MDNPEKLATDGTQDEENLCTCHVLDDLTFINIRRIVYLLNTYPVAIIQYASNTQLEVIS
jgi:hypothetical protein